MKKLFLLIALLVSVPTYAATISGSITAAGATCTSTTCVRISIPPGSGTAVVVVGANTTKTLQFEVSNDGGVSYSSVSGYPIVAGTAVTSTGSTGAWQFNVAGMTHLRVRASASSSGTATVAISTSAASMGGGGSNSTVTQGTAAAMAAPWTVVLSDGTNQAGTVGNPEIVTGPVADAAVDSALNTGENPRYTGGLFETTRTTVETGDKASFHFTATQELINSTPTPQAEGGYALPTRILSAANANLTSVKATAGQVYGWYITNTNAAARYVKLFNKATAPDPSGCSSNSDCPVMTILIPGGSTAGSGTATQFVPGISFTTGIGLAIVTGVADTSEDAVAANEIIVHLFWK
jgi:hypothetical protein